MVLYNNLTRSPAAWAVGGTLALPVAENLQHSRVSVDFSSLPHARGPHRTGVLDNAGDIAVFLLTSVSDAGL